MLNIPNALWRARDLDADAVFRDLARFPSITLLSSNNVDFPTILTLDRLVCALASPQSAHSLRYTVHSATFRRFHCLRILPSAAHTARVQRLHNVSVPTPSFVEFVDLIAAVGDHKCPLLPRGPTQAFLVWSAVRILHLSGVTFPSVTTFVRLL